MNDAHRLAVLSEVKRNKVFAILRGVQSNDIESVVQALVDGGIRIHLRESKRSPVFG